MLFESGQRLFCCVKCFDSEQLSAWMSKRFASLPSVLTQDVGDNVLYFLCYKTGSEELIVLQFRLQPPDGATAPVLRYLVLEMVHQNIAFFFHYLLTLISNLCEFLLKIF